MRITKKQFEQNKALLYERVKDFIKKEYYKLFKGFSLAESFLIIDIGNHQSIHLNPALDQVILVDKLTYHNTNLLTEETVSALSRLMVDAEIIAGSYFSHRPRLLRITDAFREKKIGDSASMYQKAETFVYKMYLTFDITQVCPNRKGVYKFKISDGSYLHLTNISRYWSNDGDYCLETGNGGVVAYYYEAQHPAKILNAIKELCKNPENLKNLAV